MTNDVSGSSLVRSRRYKLSRLVLHKVSLVLINGNFKPRLKRIGLAIAVLFVYLLYGSVEGFGLARNLAFRPHLSLFDEARFTSRFGDKIMFFGGSSYELASISALVASFAGDFDASFRFKSLAFELFENRLEEADRVSTRQKNSKLIFYMVSAGRTDLLEKTQPGARAFADSNSTFGNPRPSGFSPVLDLARACNWSEEGLDPEWSNLIRGRKVVVIGPAPDPELSEKSLSSHQNAFFIWIGALNAETRHGAPARHGIPANDLGIAMNGANSRWFSENPGFLHPESASWLLSKENLASIPLLNIHHLRAATHMPYLSGSPNMFPILLFDVLLHGAREVFVYGVDLFVGRVSYREDARYRLPIGAKLGRAIDASGSTGRSGEMLRNISLHDPIENFTIVKVLTLSCEVRGSSVFESIIGLTPHQYALALGGRFDEV